MSSRALVLLAHGSRDPNWARPIVAVAERIRARADAPAVEVAFLEFAQPNFAEAVARLATAGATHVRVAPVFLGQGGHLRRDVDALLTEARTRHPAVQFEIAPPLGEDPALLDAIAGWAMK
jgi:sirohydrochlorin cobaltochelatase